MKWFKAEHFLQLTLLLSGALLTAFRLYHECVIILWFYIAFQHYQHLKNEKD